MITNLFLFLSYLQQPEDARPAHLPTRRGGRYIQAVRRETGRLRAALAVQLHLPRSGGAAPRQHEGGLSGGGKPPQ